MKAFGLVFDDIIIFQMTIVLQFSALLRDWGTKNVYFFENNVIYCWNVIS